MTARSPRYAVIALAAALMVGAAVALKADAPPQVRPEVIADHIHRLVNLQRTRSRLLKLNWDPALARVALAHSRDQAARHELSHASRDGRDFAHRYQSAGYRCRVRVGDTIHFGAENVALGRLYNSVETRNGIARYNWNSAEQIARMTVDDWMGSAGHRANILTRHWTREGIGVVISDNNEIYITQNFC